MALITCKNLKLGYENATVVDKLDFSVNEGDYLCIVGENGSGKSTLMKAILHLMPVMEGSIEYGDGLLADEIGYLPQQTLVQRDFPASVYEIVLSGCQNHLKKRFFYSREDKKMAEANIERLGISGLKNRCYRELSGGQQQRVLLARALCATVKMLVLDEPMAGLDPQVTSELYDLILKLNKENGIAIIMVSHDIASAVRYSTHILHIGDSCIFKPVEEYRSSETGMRYIKTITEGEK
ncbi:MAG: metal ABC transporter ATP-binding protein [Lachnospiraceae bacterium]|nr:metal ABC transporter ATP-binding protein [Lachnospiraceae bacterium]